MNGKIYDALHKAEFVYIDTTLEYAFIWHGGHIIEYYDINEWACLDVWTNYKLSKHSVLENIREHVAELKNKLEILD